MLSLVGFRRLPVGLHVTLVQVLKHFVFGNVCELLCSA